MVLIKTVQSANEAMQNPPQRSIDELLEVYRDHLLSKVSKVQILGEPDESELKEVFVELSIVDQRAPQQHGEVLGMMDSAMRRRFNPFADTDRDTSPELSGQCRIRPDEVLWRRTKAIVAGAPGSGKTTLLKYLALQAHEKKRLAVWLELKAIDKPLFDEAETVAAQRGNLILPEIWLKYLTAQLPLSYGEIEPLRTYWKERFKANEIAIFLDGFDELQDEAIERKLNKCIREFASASHNNTLLISTRPYAQHKLGKERLQELEIEPLNQRQIEAFLNCYYPNDEATKNLIKTLRERSSLRELLHVPLLLGIILRLHRENRFTDERLELYEILITDLIRELDRSKSVIRHFTINDGRLRLDFLKFLAFERLLRDQLDEEEKEASRIVFSYGLLKEKARAFLTQERLSHHARGLADDVLATPLLREVGADTFAFTHLTLQEYLAASAFAAFHKGNKLEGLKIFCRAYHNPITVELEVLPMILGAAVNADKFYAEIERWPESLTFANFRLRLRGLVYGARISNERFSKVTNRILEIILKRTSDESTYRDPIFRSLIGIKGQHAETVINRITPLLEDNDSDVQLYAAMALRQIGSEKAVDALIKALREGDSFVRSSASEALGEIGGEKAVDTLIRNLSSEHSFMQVIAAEALGQTFSEKAVNALIGVLSDEDSNVRRSAAHALGQIGNDEAEDVLIKALRDKSTDAQLSAAKALRQIGSGKAVDALIKTLRDGGDDERWRAVKALGAIGNEKAVDSLIEALSDGDSDVRHCAAKALGQIGSEKAVDALIEALSDEDSSLRELTAGALGKIGSPKAVDALIKTLVNDGRYMRLGAAVALGEIGSEKAVDALIKTLGDEDVNVRDRAAYALGKIGGEKAVDALIKDVYEDGSLKLSAAVALGEIGSEKAVDALIEALSDYKGQLMGECTAVALGKIGSEKAVDVLIKTLSSEHSNVRRSAVEALGLIGGKSVIDALIKALGDEDYLRGYAAKALVNFKAKHLSKAMEKALLSEDNFSKRKAIQTVGYYSLEPYVLEGFSRIAANDPIEEIRIAAAEAKEKFARKMELLDHFSAEGTAQPLSDNESRELFLVGEAFKVAAEAGHIFRPTPNNDWGIDGEIEFKNERGEASGQRVYLQLKSGDSYLRTRKTDSKEIFTIKNPRHAEYWLNQPCTVLLVIRDSRGVRWMNVTEYLQRQGTNIKQIEFRGEPFTAESVKQMRDRFAR